MNTEEVEEIQWTQSEWSKTRTGMDNNNNRPSILRISRGLCQDAKDAWIDEAMATLTSEKMPQTGGVYGEADTQVLEGYYDSRP